MQHDNEIPEHAQGDASARDQRPPLQQAEVFEAAVESLANSGQGVTRVGGMVVFLDRGLPGQTVRAEVVRLRKRHAEARTLAVLAPAPEQVEPFCVHFGACGGCLWQDLDYPAQLAWKRRHVEESFKRLGGLGEASPEPCLPSPETRHYRNKMEFAFANAPDGLALGLFRRASHEVLNISECWLQHPLTVEIVAFAREHCRESGLPAFTPGPAGRHGFWRFLNLRLNHEGRFQVNLITADDSQRDPAVKAFATELMEAFPEVAGVVHSIRRHRAAVAIGERTHMNYGELKLPMRLGPDRPLSDPAALMLEVSANGFFQPNTGAAAALYGLVEEMAGLTGKELLWDVFCGSGGLGLWLAPKAGRLVGFEISRDAVRDARANAERLEAAGRPMPPHGVEFRPGDVEKMLFRERQLADVMVLDPPRGGAPRAVTAAIAEGGPPRVIYVSCNPATQARDLAELAETYVIARIAPVDLFPHTPHVENVVLLERR